MARLVGRTAVVVGLGLGVKAPPVQAQISPGKLSRGHASLEGSGQCLKCHDEGGVSRGKCLSCHQAVRGRVAAGKGLHARPEYRDCKTCHVEHQGLEYDLVWWGKAGRDAFDHRLTGYALEGKHGALACAACHQARLNADKDALAAAGTNLARTYFGLATACLSCHADEHRGQFAGRGCVSCHDMAGWKPAGRFDHAKTAYPLTGRHASVACAKCHALVSPGPGGSYRQYKGVVARECSNCHRDVHDGRFGPACATCHLTSSWRAKPGRFDHDRTQYPLRAKHASLACDKCHPPGRPLRIPFARCTDCHADAHLGQLAPRADQGRCEACHDVAGFTPAKFPPEEHVKTRYPLSGAHLAVPCDACHRPVGPETLRRVSGLVLTEAAARAGRKTTQFRFASTRCAECHRDLHAGELDRYMAKDGCAACHRIESWRQLSFDHAQTRFPLSGGHAKPACAACHPRTDVRTPRERPRLANTPLLCAACHKDPHESRLARAGSTACEGCHAVEGWKPTRFDHARDGSFELDGAHVRLACAACHRVEKKDGAVAVRYKPLPRTCKGCHGPSPATSGAS